MEFDNAAKFECGDTAIVTANAVLGGRHGMPISVCKSGDRVMILNTPIAMGPFDRIEVITDRGQVGYLHACELC